MNEELILEIKLDENDNDKRLVDLNQLIAEQRQRVLDLTAAMQTLSKSEGASSEQVAKITKNRDAMAKSLSTNIANQKNLVQVINSETGSVNSLNAQNKILLSERNALSGATETEKLKIEALNKQMDANTAKIKSQSNAQEQQRMNIGKYIQTVQIGGVSLEGLATKFASPYALAGAALAGLYKLYSSSTQGARDLEIAQTKLNGIYQAFANQIGELGGGESGGKGLFSKMLDGALVSLGLFGLYGASIAAEVKEHADKEAELMEIRRQRFFKVYQEAAEQQQRTRDDEQKTLDVRIVAAKAVLENVRAANTLIISTSKEQLEAKNKLLAKDKENIDLKIQVAKAESTVADIQEASTKRETAALEALIKLQADQKKALVVEPFKSQPIPQGITNNDKNQKALDKIYKDQQLADKQQYLQSAETQSEFQTRQFNSYIKYLNQKRKAAKAYGEDVTELDERIADAQIAEAQRTEQVVTKTNKTKTQSNLQTAQALDNILSTSLALFDKNSAEFQIAAISKALVDAYLAAGNALAQGGPIAMVATLALGLANVAAIEGIALAGGGDFYTNKPTLLLVGDNPGGVERVRVDPISGTGQTKKFNPANGLPGGVAMAGGGTLQVNRTAESNSLMRSINSSVKQTQTILVLQDFEIASRAKDTPINRAKVLSK